MFIVWVHKTPNTFLVIAKNPLYSEVLIPPMLRISDDPLNFELHKHRIHNVNKIKNPIRSLRIGFFLWPWRDYYMILCKLVQPKHRTQTVAPFIVLNLIPLSEWIHNVNKIKNPIRSLRIGFFLWPWRDSNPQPTVPETVILSSWTTEPIRVAKIEKNLLHLQIKTTFDFLITIYKITSLSVVFQKQTTHRANELLP